MIYKFKSKAAGDVIMMQPNGDQVLRILGKAPGGKGIVTVAELPAAISTLEAAIGSGVGGGDPKPAGDRDGEDRSGAEAAELVSLQRRVWPLLEMMKASLAARADVVWGV